MPAFREFEKEAIRLMAANVLSEGQLRHALEADRPSSYNHTGGGHFLAGPAQLNPLLQRTATPLAERER